jgi:hypothetical protein
MPLVDTGNDQPLFPSAEAHMIPPSQWPARAKQGAASVPALLKSMAIPTAAGLGTEAALTALGVPEAGVIPLLVRAGAQGVTNVATSKMLPEEWGGTPNMPTWEEFAFGAAPEALRAGGSAIAEHWAERKLAKRAGQLMESEVGKLDPSAQMVEGKMLEPAAGVPFPANYAGPELTNATNEARGPAQRTIQAARTKYGQPIGDAYRALKGEEPLTENAAKRLADDAAEIESSMISPGAGTRSWAQRFKAMAPPEVEPEEGEFKALIGRDKAAIVKDLGGGEFADVTPPEAKKYSPPTLDELRNMRQQINLQLQKASGGDVYGLGMLQDRLDDELMNHLPDNMSELRNQYRGFIKRWGYAAERQLNNLGQPQEVADWMFKNPKRAYDLMKEAGPQDAEKLRQNFLQYIYGDLDTMAPRADQAKAVRAKLAPYMQNPDLAAAVMGPQAGEQMRLMTSWAKYSKDFADNYRRDPQFREELEQGFRDYFLKQGMDPDKAMHAAMQQMFASGGPVPAQLGQTVMPQLPSVLQKPPSATGFASRAPLFYGAMGTAAAVTGHPAAIAYRAAELLGWMGADKGSGFAAASGLGITRHVLNAFASDDGRTAGRWLARGIATTGAQAIQQSRPQEVELGE